MSHFDYSLDDAVDEVGEGTPTPSALNRIKFDVGPAALAEVEKRIEEGMYSEAVEYVEKRR